MKIKTVFTSLCLALCINNAQALDITPESLIRTEDQTYLTIPEWYLVHSPNEYADYLGAGRSPSQFPFAKHILQFWDTYYQSHMITKDKYPFNLEYHIMVSTIGVSTTVEYTMKGLYESFVGSVTEFDSYSTPEDRYASKISKDYVEFIKIDPWYKFDFMGAVKGLWNENDFFGPNFIRKIERKYSLTTEYLVKAGYASLIKYATGAAFTPPIPYSSVLIDGNLNTYTDNIVLLSNKDGNDLLRLPRYGEFTVNLVELAKENKNFIEICGNKTKITVAILPPVDFDITTYKSKVFINQPIYTNPNIKRVIYEVEIKDLGDMLRDLNNKNIKIEHIYDF